MFSSKEEHSLNFILKDLFYSVIFQPFPLGTVPAVFTRPFLELATVPTETNFTSGHILGTASGFVWNRSGRSRVNARPKRTHLGKVPTGTDPV